MPITVDMDPQASYDHDGDGMPKPTAVNIKSNYGSRFIEISRLSGAPFQGAYYASALSNANSTDQVTADIQIGSVIGNGAGLVGGLMLHYLAQKYYRTGSHELHWLAAPPSEATIGSLAIKSDGAYVRHGNKLYYIDNITKTFTLLDIQEKDFECFYEKMKVGTSKALKSEKIKEISAKIPNHTHVSGKTSTNPMYRNYKTLANFGWQVGATLSNFFGIEDPYKRKLISCIMSDICCFVIGLFAIPYWLIREKILKISANSRHKYAVTGNEGWSKYARTALVFGICVGQAVGGFIVSVLSNASASVVSFSIGFWGGVVGVGSFIIGLIAVPLINWSTSKGYQLCLVADEEKITADSIPKKTIVLKRYQGQIKAYYVKGGKIAYPVDLRLTAEEIAALKFPPKGRRLLVIKKNNPQLVDTITSQCTLGALASDDKNHIRNNYTRSGITLGAGFGACLGLLIGNWCFGLVLGGIIFSAFGSVVCGVVFSFASHKLHRIMHQIPKDYKLYLMEEGEAIDPEDIPNEGKKTLILKKEGASVKAYKVRGKKVSAPVTLRLTIEEIESLSFPAAGTESKLINREDIDKKLFETLYSQTEDLENSWDYVTRSTAGMFSFIGAAVVCLINPAAALLLVPIGSAIAGAIGWGLGLLIMRKARQLHEEEQKAETLPWTQRITTGVNVGSIIGGLLGIAIGCAGFIFAGPASIIFAVSFFGAIGAVIGGICAALWDKRARALIYEGIKSFFIGPSSSDGIPRETLLRSNSYQSTGSDRTDSPIPNMASTAKMFYAIKPQDPIISNSVFPTVIAGKDKRQIRRSSSYDSHRFLALQHQKQDASAQHSRQLQRSLSF